MSGVLGFTLNMNPLTPARCHSRNRTALVSLVAFESAPTHSRGGWEGGRLQMGADHSSNRRNAIFTAGVMCEFSGAHAAPFYPTCAPNTLTPESASEWSHLSVAGGAPTAGVPGWAREDARQPSQTPREGGAGRRFSTAPSEPT
jgi:hypothetical protein